MNMTTSLEMLALTTANDIDKLVMLDKMVKAYEAELKALKENVANKYGEGEHRGDVYSVAVRLDPTTTTKWAAVAKEANVPATLIAKYTTKGARIVVTAKA
jgi:hypothetical protein